MLDKIHMYVHERLEKEPSDWESYLQIVRGRYAGVGNVLYEKTYGLKIEMRMLESNQQERSKEALDQLNKRANSFQKSMDNYAKKFTLSLEYNYYQDKSEITLAEVKMSIGEMQLADLKKRVSSEITKEQPDLALLRQLKKEA